MDRPDVVPYQAPMYSSEGSQSSPQILVASGWDIHKNTLLWVQVIDDFSWVTVIFAINVQCVIDIVDY